MRQPFSRLSRPARRVFRCAGDRRAAARTTRVVVLPFVVIPVLLAGDAG